MFRLVVLLVIAVIFGITYARWQENRKRRGAVVRLLAEQIGRRAVVTEAINGESGVVRINGEGYAACAENGAAIGPRVLVEVVGVRRLQLVVRKLEGMGQLIDVDHLTGASRPKGGD